MALSQLFYIGLILAIGGSAMALGPWTAVFDLVGDEMTTRWHHVPSWVDFVSRVGVSLAFVGAFVAIGAGLLLIKTHRSNDSSCIGPIA